MNKKSLIRFGAVAAVACLFAVEPAMATTTASTSMPVTSFLDKFVNLLTGDVARMVAFISLVLAIMMFAWNQHQGNEATGLFKTLGIVGMSVCALCGVGQVFQWMGYGALLF